MSKEFKIELTTADKFWTPKGLGSIGMDPYRAISELVANSIDWRQPTKKKVDSIIQIIIDRGVIEVRDNGVGMSITELQDAIQLSVANNEKRPNLRVRKGMFGMGMKVACFSLGWDISIRTRSTQEPLLENVLHLNTRSFDHNEDKRERDNIRGKQTRHDLSGPLSNWESGTSIIIRDLTNKYLKAIPIRDSLQEVFSPEIGVGEVFIEVIDLESNEIYPCKKTEVAVFEKFTINLDELDLFVKNDAGEKMQITGWIGLLKTAASGTGKWGLHLFKDNQVIERFHQLPSRLGGLMTRNPHPMYGRTFGEIHLNMCKPNFHKVGFDYSTQSWETVQALLNPHIEKIMVASSEYRAGDEKQAHKALKKIQQHKKASKKAMLKLKQQQEDENTPDEAFVLPNGEWFIIIEPIAESFGPNSRLKPWRYHFREESKELVIVINKASEIYENHVLNSFNDEVMEIVINWAISDCLMLFLHDRFNYDLDDALKFRNEQLLTKLFSKSEGRV
jgi:hypothetical protein